MSTRLPAVLNSSFTMTAELHPIECSVRLNIDPMSQSEMTVMADEAPDVRGWVEVFTPHGSAGIFRVSRRESSYVEGEVHITLDHGICTLMDDLAPEGASDGNTLYYSGTPKQVLTQILAKQTSGNQYWQVGSAPNTGSVKIDVEWENLLDLLTKLMDELPGYMLTFDQTTDPWTVGIAARPSSVSAEGRLSRNVTSARITLDDSDMCTRVYAAALPEPHYLTSTTSSTYGIIAQKLSTADGITEQQAEDICTAYLDIHDHPAVSVEIDGAELCQLTGDSFDELKIGKLYRLAIPDYGVVQEECITSLYYSAVYDNPLGVQITLANDAKDLTSHLTKVQKAVKSAGRGAARAEEKADEAASGYVDYTHYKEETDQKFSLLYKETDWDAAYEEKQRKGAAYETILEQTARKFSLLATESIYDSATAANPLIGQLQSNLEVTARKIQSTVSATGLALNADGSPQTDSDGNYVFNGSHNSLDSQITQKAGQIQTLITKTGINELGNAETLYSKIDQTYNAISMIVDSNTGRVTPAKLILAINGDQSSATISADKIDLQGYVTASQLDAEKARLNNLMSGSVYATRINTNGLGTRALYLDSGGGFLEYVPRSVQMEINGSIVSGTYLGLSSQNALTLTHAHAVSVDSGGVLTLGAPCSVGSASANFNIADTQYFKNAVSAAKNEGWDLARTFLVEPAASTASATMTVGIPSSTYNVASSYNFTVSTDASYAYIKDGLNRVVARCTNSGGGGTVTLSSSISTNPSIISDVDSSRQYTVQLGTDKRRKFVVTASNGEKIAALFTANKPSVTLDYDTWKNNPDQATAGYQYTLNPGDYRKFRVRVPSDSNTSNHPSVDILVTASTTATVDTWTASISSSNTDYGLTGRAMTITTGVSVNGVAQSGSASLGRLYVYYNNSNSVTIKIGGRTIGNFTIDHSNPDE